MNIPISVTNKVASAPDDVTIVCGNSDYTLTFDFDSEWSAETEKTARFIWTSGKKTKYSEVCFTGNTVTMPILTNTYAVRVGVYAGDLRTTTPAKITCKPSILCPDGVEDKSTPTVWTILQKRLDALMKEAGGHLNASQVEQLIEKHLNAMEHLTPRVITISLPASKWSGSNGIYSQSVSMDGVTVNSKVDLLPSPEQLEELLTAEISMTTANTEGTVTVFAIGYAPTTDFTMQAMVTEVST